MIAPPDHDSPRTIRLFLLALIAIVIGMFAYRAHAHDHAQQHHMTKRQ